VTRVYVDFSVFTPASSVGVVNGYMDLDVIPREGDMVAFDKPHNPVEALDVSEFTPRLAVEAVSPPVAGNKETLLSLADVTVASRADALKVAAYLEKGFGLFFNEHDVNR
jgi:hypothetical protein